MKKGYVLITGGNKGIGLELAKLFAKNNHPLILVGTDILALFEARNTIKKNYNVQVNLIQRDLTKRNAPREVYDLIKEKNIQVDILVNNAGFGTYGPFIETDMEKELNLIELNIRALTYFTKLFSKDMAKRYHGKILNVSSTGAFQGGSFMAVYFASKAYVLHFSEAIYREFKPYGVQVTALCPGPTQTNFTDCAKGSAQTRIFQSMLSSKRVAKAGYNALMKNKMFKVVGIKNNLLRQFNRLLPRKTVADITHYFLLKEH